MDIRNLADFVSTLIGRSRLSNIAGHTFRGKRDIYKALGYNRELFINDYRSRFDRNEIANRVVKALPKATWRGGAELIEDEDPTTSTAFEQAFETLNEKFRIWSLLQRADILAGIGRYAVILIGAPGDMSTPLESCTPENLMYLMTYSEEDCRIFKFDIDPFSPRFGRPLLYNLTRQSALSPEAMNTNIVAKQVHWTRIIHVADGLLDDNVYGEPRLKCIWNRLDDLEKVAGGGAEAFWKRADGGTQFDLDPTIDFEDSDPNAATANTADATVAAAKTSGLKHQVDEFEHGLRRNLLTRGVKIERLGSDVADFKSPVDAIIGLISAGTGIPQRVLMGSEQGKLAAKMDRSNWDDRVSDRRDDYAGPFVVREIIDRFIGLGIIPAPAESYDVRWAELKIMDDDQRATIAGEWAALNQAAGEVVVTADEIRDRVLGLPPLADVTTGIQEPAAAARFLRKWSVLKKVEREFYGAKIRAAAAVARKPAAKDTDEALLNVLEAAIIHGQTKVIEHLTGMHLTVTPESSTEVVRELQTLNDRQPGISAEITALTEAVIAAVNRPQPAPVVNVTVEPPPTPVVPAPKVMKRVTRTIRDPRTQLVERYEEHLEEVK